MSFLHNVLYMHDPLKLSYRKDHSKEAPTSITKIHRYVISIITGKRGSTVLTSLDLSAAFDTVDYELPLHHIIIMKSVEQLISGVIPTFVTHKVCTFSSYSETR